MATASESIELSNSILIVGAVAVAPITAAALTPNGVGGGDGTITVGPILKDIPLDGKLMVILNTGQQVICCYDVELLMPDTDDQMALIYACEQETIRTVYKAVRLL
jgi:hypothetical protein